MNHSSDSDRGAIIIFVAICLLVIFAFVSLAIDLARVTHSSSEKTYVAGHLALAGLERYLDFEPTESEICAPDPAPCALLLPGSEPSRRRREHELKFSKAFDRIWQLGANSFSVFRARGDVLGQQVRGAGDLASGSVPPPPGFRGGVVPGRWWDRKPTTCILTGCPCTIDNTNPVACFQSCDVVNGCVNPDGSTDTPFANSLRVGLQNEAGSGVANYFAAAFGQDNTSTKGEAYGGGAGGTAAAVQKWGVFIIDLGRTSNIESPFLPFERNPPGSTTVKEVSYRIMGGAPLCNGTVNPIPCAGCTIQNLAGKEAGYAANYGANGSAANYRCHVVQKNGSPENHLVNLLGAPPEPLTTLMSSAHDMLKFMKASNSTADRTALLGIDHEFIAERFIDFTDIESPEFQRMLDITDPAQRNIAADNFFFPRTGAKTDLPFALLTAYEQLKNKVPLFRVDPYVIVFTNGLSVGERVTNETLPSYGRYPVASDTTADKNLLYDEHLKSLGELMNVVGPTVLDPDKVKVHVVMAGSKLKPHSVLLRSLTDPTKCMADNEIRASGFLGVLPAKIAAQDKPNYLTLGDNATNSYLQSVTYLYSTAALMQGYFTMLRPSCKDAAFGGSFLSATGGLYSTPDELCVKGLLGPATVPGNAASSTYVKAVKDSRIPPATMDADGRLFCNPYADDITDQSEKFFRDVLEKRPILLVTPSLW